MKTRRTIRPIILVTLTIGAAGLLSADGPLGADTCQVQAVKLLDPDPLVGDQLGSSVAISGDTAVVGVPFDVDAGIATGAAYVLERNQGGPDNWGVVRKLIAADVVAGDRFGIAVAIEGDTIVVGANHKYGQGDDSGAAYVFDRDHGGPENWGEVRELRASDGGAGDEFGFSLAIDRDTAVVGAHWATAHYLHDGAAYVFERDAGGADNWGEVRRLTASDRAPFDHFANSVDISGDLVIVGAPDNDDAGWGSGSAYLFGRDEGGPADWGVVKKLVASDASEYAGFGYAVTIDGDTVAITGGGSAYVFGRDEGGADDWGEVQKLTASDAASGVGLRGSVDLEADALLVGASYYDEGSYWGLAYLFARDGGGADPWGEVQKLIPADPSPDSHFGRSVAVSGSTMLAGAPLDDEGGEDAGAAYLFTPGPPPIWYADGDADGFGDPADSMPACDQPIGYVADGSDCDDGSVTTFPGAAENDSVTECMKDDDGDGYGDDSPHAGVTPGSDCDDTNPEVNPGFGEYCANLLDDDCDGWIDEEDPDCFPVPAGRVPGQGLVPGEPLRLERDANGWITLTWDVSCGPDDAYYVVYAGVLGDFTSHAFATWLLFGETSTTLGPTEGALYFLVVPMTRNREGSYGVDSTGTERPQAVYPVAPQAIVSCD